jgi:hypothetical protein
MYCDAQFAGQFHQHFTRRFFVRKFCVQLFCMLAFQVSTILAQEYWRKSCSKNVGEIDT